MRLQASVVPGIEAAENCVNEVVEEEGEGTQTGTTRESENSRRRSSTTVATKSEFKGQGTHEITNHLISLFFVFHFCNMDMQGHGGH